MTLQERVALCFDQLEECRDRIDALVKKNEKLENRVLELEALLATKSSTSTSWYWALLVLLKVS